MRCWSGIIRRMDTRVDLVAYDRLGTARVLVEVKNKPVSSTSWAVEFRRNLLAHGRLPPADYFVVATPTMIHIWKGAAGPEEPPAVSVNSREYWPRYFRRSLPGPGSGAFELIVASWLSDVAQHWDTHRPPEADARLLEEIGLPQAIRGGRVEHCVAA